MLRDRWIFGRKSSAFTLQWHLTNACEFHCSHCYDRSARSILRVDQACAILRDFLDFCRSRRVRGHVCLTGGDPFLYPGFLDLYEAIARTGASISILGNPAPREELTAMAEIQAPVYYQLSLEGLPDHNDRIRGPGHFAKVVETLGILTELDVRAHVMLTLTQDNLDQVIPLGERLYGAADRLTFNRLSQVGEGAELAPPSRDEYVEFMRRYMVAARSNPILWFKDNLFNIVRYHYSRPFLRGCTGFGCGAAFNFVALLPDGEVHACRKFPSPIGNILESGFQAIYDSPQAKRYRRGCDECRPCPVREVCGGCLAVSWGLGYDIFRQRDPHCFMGEREHYLGGWGSSREFPKLS